MKGFERVVKRFPVEPKTELGRGRGGAASGVDSWSGIQTCARVRERKAHRERKDSSR